MSAQIGTSAENIDRVYETYVQMVHRICLMYFPKNPFDVEDAMSEVFLKYIVANPFLENHEHEKAWLITTARNVCKNMLRHWWRKNVSIEGEEITLCAKEVYSDKLLDIVYTLPEKQKMCIYLFYYEGYSCSQIGKILDISENSVYGNLNKGRKKLKGLITEEN